MVEYLSGERIQGSSTAEANTTVTDNLSTDTGWVSNGTGNGYDATNDRVNFKLSCPPDSSSFAGGRVIIDLQDSDWLDGSNLATNFIMRYRWRVSAMADASANENRSYMGFFSSSAWGGDAQDVFAIQFWANTSGIQTFRLECIDNDTFQSGNETRTITSFTPVVDTDYYIEMKKEGDVHTMRVTTNSDYTGGTTASVTKSNISNLRYFGFKARGDNQNNGGNNQGYVSPDIKLWNNATSATKDEKDDLTNVPIGTRYEEVDTRKIWRWASTASGSSHQQTNGDENVALYSANGGGIIGGVIWQTGHALIGKEINKVTLKSLKNGTPSGLAYCEIWTGADGQAGTKVFTFASKTANDFPSSLGDVVFFNETATHTVSVNDRMVLRYADGDSSDNVVCRMYNLGAESNAQWIDYPSGAFRTQSGRSFAYKAELASVDKWIERGVAS